MPNKVLKSERSPFYQLLHKGESLLKKERDKTERQNKSANSSVTAHFLLVKYWLKTDRFAAFW
ncbi:hypothetical protein B6N13_11535 [Marinomonas sp. UCMA 3892]|nr:hypothetical protein [Marinomonas sp. UCMA 3892]